MDVMIYKEEFPLTSPDRGFQVRAFYIKEQSDVLVEIFRNNEPYRRFLYPAYKIWNIVHHFPDIITSEIEGNFQGYELAGWTGFSVIYPREFLGCGTRRDESPKT